MKSKRKIINYPVNYYPCNVVINGRWFVELWVSQYYKSKRGRLTVNDEIIQELVKQLYGIEKERSENGYYDHKPLYIDHRAYNLVWDYDESPFTTNSLIMRSLFKLRRNFLQSSFNCYREKKHDKK